MFIEDKFKNEFYLFFNLFKNNKNTQIFSKSLIIFNMRRASQIDALWVIRLMHWILITQSALIIITFFVIFITNHFHLLILHLIHANMASKSFMLQNSSLYSFFFHFSILCIYFFTFPILNYHLKKKINDFAIDSYSFV